MKSLWPSRLLLLAVGAAAVLAAVAVYGSGSRFPLPYVTVLFSGRTTEWASSALYFAAFAAAFVLTISGVPAASATPTRHSIFAVALGGSTGALMYHELDPAYDSVFFATGNAVAASHAPATVVLFTTGLGVAYLAAGGAVRALVARQRWGRRGAVGGRALAGVATALLGLAILTGRFRVVRGLLF